MDADIWSPEVPVAAVDPHLNQFPEHVIYSNNRGLFSVLVLIASFPAVMSSCGGSGQHLLVDWGQ